MKRAERVSKQGEWKHVQAINGREQVGNVVEESKAGQTEEGGKVEQMDGGKRQK